MLTKQQLFLLRFIDSYIKAGGVTLDNAAVIHDFMTQNFVKDLQAGSHPTPRTCAFVIPGAQA